MRTLRDDNILRLSDGRRLGYAEYGDPEGEPIMLFHDTPGSRLYWKLLPGFPFLPNLHIIALERAGYGLSDWKPGRTLLAGLMKNRGRRINTKTPMDLHTG